MKKLSASTKVYLVGGISFLLLLLGRVFFTAPPPEENASLFGSLQLKADSAKLTPLQEEEKEKEGSLRYKVQVKKENPFLALYREEKPVGTPPKKVHKPIRQKKQEKGFFRVSNPELRGGDKLFEAKLREKQVLQFGKVLDIILKEPIPALDLKVGSVLKGIPRPSSEDNRILITITAGVTYSTRQRLSLTCYDEDLQEGLYYDKLSYQLEDEIKESLVDEILDIDFKGRELTKKGVAIARKYKNMYLEKDRVILIGITPKKEKNNR
jgi:hypothetical protein